jgi:uncharacterized protein YkwD
MRSRHNLSLLVTFSVAGMLLAGGCPTSESGFDFFGAQNSDADANNGNGIRPSDAGLASPPVDNPGDSDSALGITFPACGEPDQADAWRDEVMRLVNQARAQVGAGPVVQNDILERQATEYACQMIQFDFFDHVNPVDGSTLGERASDFGYAFLVVGENLAAGQTTPQQAFQDWMDSPGHRRNILDPRFTELGVGVRTGGTYGVYWVQEFGQPAR